MHPPNVSLLVVAFLLELDLDLFVLTIDLDIFLLIIPFNLVLDIALILGLLRLDFAVQLLQLRLELFNSSRIHVHLLCEVISLTIKITANLKPNQEQCVLARAECLGIPCFVERKFVKLASVVGYSVKEWSSTSAVIVKSFRQLTVYQIKS